MLASPDSTPISNRAAKPATSNARPPRSAQLAGPARRHPRRLRTHRALPPRAAPVPVRLRSRNRRGQPAALPALSPKPSAGAKNDRVDVGTLRPPVRLGGTPPKAPTSAISRSARRSSSYTPSWTPAPPPLIQLFDLIGKADTALQACIASDPELARRAAIIRSIPGFGPANAASLCADMPELGSINRRQAAAIGVAPYDRDSGQSSAGRRIQGGRRSSAQPALHGRHFSQSPDASLPSASAPAASSTRSPVVMRKLITLVNALPRRPRMAACTGRSARPSHDLRHSLPHSRSAPPVVSVSVRFPCLQVQRKLRANPRWKST